MRSSQRSFNTRAVVLKNIKYKDSDKIYTIFSEDKGKISVIGSGVRKISSRRSGNMDTLNLVDIKLSEHESGQLYLSEVQLLDSYKEIKSDYDLMLHGFYIAELISKTTQEDEHAHEIFDLLKNTLEKIQKSPEQNIIIINKFEIKLMQLLGYQPPKDMLLAWQEKMREKNFNQADSLVKNFIKEIVGERIKSLELG